MRPISLPALLCLSVLVGCTALPDLGPSPDRRAPWPGLLPLDSLTASAVPVSAPRFGANLQDRATALKARAAALRGRPIIERALRQRMEAALRRNRR